MLILKVYLYLYYKDKFLGNDVLRQRSIETMKSSTENSVMKWGYLSPLNSVAKPRLIPSKSNRVRFTLPGLVSGDRVTVFSSYIA